MSPNLYAQLKAKNNRELYAAKAAVMWNSMSENDKAGIRFGLFPFAYMQAAEKEGFSGRDLCVALMDCASRDGGMRA